MKYLILIVLILSFSSFSQARTQHEKTYWCLKRVKQTLSPYVNLPEYRGTFEHLQLKEDKDAKAFYWDVVKEDRVTRYISTEKGSFECSFDASLKDKSKINSEVLNKITADTKDSVFKGLMVATGWSVSSVLTTQYSFHCTKGRTYYGTNQETQRHKPAGLIDEYISWIPQLYKEDLIAQGTKVGGRDNTPGQFLFGINQSCHGVLDLYGSKFSEKIRRKERGLAAIYQSFEGASDGTAATSKDLE